MRKVKLAELMALPDETRRNVLRVVQSVHENRQLIKAMLAETAPEKKADPEPVMVSKKSAVRPKKPHKAKRKKFLWW